VAADAARARRESASHRRAGCKDRQEGLVQAERLAGVLCQPESDTSCTPDPAARSRRRKVGAGGEADGAPGGEVRSAVVFLRYHKSQSQWDKPKVAAVPGVFSCTCYDTTSCDWSHVVTLTNPPWKRIQLYPCHACSASSESVQSPRIACATSSSTASTAFNSGSSLPGS
jgi:hypothetical protein